MPTVSVRLPGDDAESLDAAAELLEADKSTVMRQALRLGLADLRTQHAVARYQTGDVAAMEAARLAGLSVAEWLEVAREHTLTTQLSPDDLREDARIAREL